VPLFRTDVERTTWLIEARGAEIELCYDKGVIEAGDANDAIHEVELELRKGEVDTLFGTARQFARQIPIRLGVAAKSERGFALASGKGDLPTKAVHASIRPDTNVAEGFAAIAGACLKHFRLNEPLLLRTRDAEAMHQVRVAIRRLRTALWLFRPAVKDKQFPAINGELRKLTRELGAARNIDVILASMSAGDPARGHLERNRERLYTRIFKMLDSRRFRLFLLDLLAWTHGGDWRQGKKAQKPLARFARKRLDKLWNQISERGAKLSTLAEDERHKLRIDAKKMRYALEFLGGLVSVGGDAQREFVRAAEGIQDALGRLNDLTMRQGAMAWGVADSDKEVGRCLRAAKRHLRQMAKIGPFWAEAA
jgi:inorganic triphosphatase YgiF